MKAWAWGIVGLGAVVVVGAAGAAAYLWTPNETLDAGAAREAAAGYDARIIRDRFGVPHIYGARNADVSFGLAYAHAEDDWKHIQDVVLTNRGQMARLNGEEAAASDVLMLALGNIQNAASNYEKVSPQARAVAEAYAAGLNLWCAENPDSGCEAAAPVHGRDIVAGFATRPVFFYGLDREIRGVLEAEGPVDLSVKDARQAYLGVGDDVDLGSNAIAVSPARSADGHTRLWVNSHQPYTGTVSWYEARLKSEEGIDAIGGLFPGSPLLLGGVGPNLAWGATVNAPDISDVFLLEVDDPKKPRRYKMDGEWRDLEVTPLKIRVKLWGPFGLPVTREGYRSAHGPAFVTERGVFAVSYAGDKEIRHLDQYLSMNTAKSLAEWRAGQTSINAIPSINYVVADRLGNIGYFWNAAMPTREPGWDRKKVLPGNISETMWKGREPVEKLPYVINPPSGYVVNANHSPLFSSSPEDSPKAENYPKDYGLDTLETNRGLQAQVLYGSDASITREEFIAYKHDHSYAPAANVREMVVNLLARGDQGDAELKAALDVLATWDFAADQNNRAAALAILTGQQTMGSQIHGETTVEKAAETLKATAARLKGVYGRIDPTWGEVSRVCRGDQSWPTDGGPDTLRAMYAGGELEEQGHLCGRAGDTYVAMIDWAPDGSYVIDTIHQFGSATMDENSPHYADQAPLFARKEYKQPPMTLEGVLAQATRDYRPGRGE
jgi:acyl-homoserine-lactone acylase